MSKKARRPGSRRRVPARSTRNPEEEDVLAHIKRTSRPGAPLNFVLWGGTLTIGPLAALEPFVLILPATPLDGLNALAWLQGMPVESTPQVAIMGTPRSDVAAAAWESVNSLCGDEANTTTPALLRSSDRCTVLMHSYAKMARSPVEALHTVIEVLTARAAGLTFLPEDSRTPKMDVVYEARVEHD